MYEYFVIVSMNNSLVRYEYFIVLDMHTSLLRIFFDPNLGRCEYY